MECWKEKKRVGKINFSTNVKFVVFLLIKNVPRVFTINI